MAYFPINIKEKSRQNLERESKLNAVLKAHVKRGSYELIFDRKRMGGRLLGFSNWVNRYRLTHRNRVYAAVQIALILTLQIAAPSWCSNFVRVQPIDGNWYFVDAQDRAFISRGVDTVAFDQDYIQHTKDCPYAKNAMERHHSQQNWRKATAERLLSLNFNTLGAWSDIKVAQESTNKKKPLYYTVILHASDSFEDWNHTGLCDFFDPKFATSVRALCQKICTPLKDDPKLIGYFGDNELYWVLPNNPLLLQYLNLAPDAPGRRAAISFLQRHYATFADFNRVWNTDFNAWNQLDTATKIAPGKGDRDTKDAYEKDCDTFASFAATRYFDIVDLSIKLADPNHLNLGCRFSSYPGIQILRACAAHVDVVSFNCYEPDPTKTIKKYSTVGKPLLIGEFSFRAKDSGLPNTKGAGPIVENQTSRAEWFESYVKNALKAPNIAGYHWFEHIDQPKEGRFDGENSNYGIANIEDVPYEQLNRAMKEINLQSLLLHEKAGED